MRRRDGVPDQVVRGTPNQGRVTCLKFEIRRVVTDNAACAEQPGIRAKVDDVLQSRIDIEIRVNLPQIGLKRAERRLPPGPLLLSVDAHLFNSLLSATRAEWSRFPSPRRTRIATKAETMAVVGNPRASLRAASATIPRYLW